MQKRKSNNSGCVCYEESRDRYKALFTSPITGKRISKRFKTKKEAEVWLAEQITNAEKGLYIEPSSVTLLDWMVEYFETYAKPKLKTSTLALYIEIGEMLEPIAGYKLQKLTASRVQKFLNDVERTENQKLKMYKLLVQLFRKAYSLEMISKNIMDLVETPKYEQEEIQTFTNLDIKKILSTVQESKYYSKYYPFFLFAATSGCRLAEITGLKITKVFKNHVHIDNSMMRVKNSKRIDSKPKTKAGVRDVTLPAEVIKQLRIAYRYEGRTLGGYVFHTKTGKPLSISNIQRTWTKILEEAGLEHKHFHALRHTHATELLAQNIPIIEVSKRLGHAKVSYTLDLYGHKIAGYGTKIADTVNNMLDLEANCSPNCSQMA